MEPGRARWAYLGLSFVMNVLLGSAYSWSVFVGPLKAQYGADAFTALLPFGVALATFAFGMGFVGRFVDRYGPRKVSMIGGVLVSGGYVLSFLMDKTPLPPIAVLTLTYGVVMGLGIGFSYSAPIPTASRWFPDRKGLATGLVVMGYGLSPLFTAPLATALMGTGPYDVPFAFLVLGIAFFVVLVPLGSLLRFPPADWKAPAPKGAAAKKTWASGAEVGTRAMVRTPTFWTAWLLYVLGTAGGFMVIGNAKDIAMGVRTLDGAVVAGFLGTLAVQVMAVFNSVGRPIFGRLADVVDPRRTLRLMYLVLLGGMAVISVASAYEPLVAGIAITAVSFGGFLAVMPALAAFYFGQSHLGSNYGMLFTGYGLGALVATAAAGPIVNAFGSYVPAFYVGIALSLAGFAVSLLIRPPRPVVARAEVEVAAPQA